MPDHPVALVADRLIDGTGRDPIEAAAVVWEGDRLTAIGARAGVRIPADAEVIEDHDLTVLPGLMDLHVHLGMQAGVNFPRILMTPRALALLYAVPNCSATLRAGFTTVRDAGLTPAGVRVAVERGLFPGPRMQLAVSILGQTGGHADPFMPCGVGLDFGSGLDIPAGVVDGVDGMRQRVREVLRSGADWIKLCTSGGVLSASDTPDAAQLTVDEIATAVYEAQTQGKGCMAHAMSAQGIKNALRAGVRTIEHGCFLDEEGIALMKQRGATLVPTLVAPVEVIRNAEKDPASIPESMVEKARDTVQRHAAAFRAAVEAGVEIAMGTDSGVGDHGRNGQELALMAERGMTPMQAILASTRTPARVLGLADRLGTLEVGKLADLVAVRGDPLAEIGLFNDPGRVQVVVKAGAILHQAGRPLPVPAGL
ncbi:MAG TPA: amidohydrolase family protein [Candidatus Eisenbacteria bacterium]|nr:amidohydrolase family protein [Candidatus Eisenbacteria bacterium]